MNGGGGGLKFLWGTGPVDGAGGVCGGGDAEYDGAAGARAEAAGARAQLLPVAVHSQHRAGHVALLPHAAPQSAGGWVIFNPPPPPTSPIALRAMLALGGMLDRMRSFLTKLSRSIRLDVPPPFPSWAVIARVALLEQ